MGRKNQGCFKWKRNIKDVLINVFIFWEKENTKYIDYIIYLKILPYEKKIKISFSKAARNVFKFITKLQDCHHNIRLQV